MPVMGRLFSVTRKVSPSTRLFTRRTMVALCRCHDPAMTWVLRYSGRTNATAKMTYRRWLKAYVLRSVVEHVFLPPKLPQEAPDMDAERGTNVALCHILIHAAAAFRQYLSPSQWLVWDRMPKMMDSIYRAANAPLVDAELEGVLTDLAVDDVFVMHVRAQNAAVLVRVLDDHVRFEMFEVSPQASIVMSANGKLLCSYPGPAVQVSREVFEDPRFLSELASFLIQMDIDLLDSTATTDKAGSTVCEVRESAHPRYISELLVGILRGIGQPSSVDRITKRMADEVLWKDALRPWRRSPLWLVIRVALQTSLDSDTYKTFMLFFRTHLLQICVQRGFPSEMLYLMRIKMARRLSKLDPTVSDDISQVVRDTVKETEVLLQSRWTSFQKSQSTSPPWDPAVLNFDNDTAISLNNSRPYLMKALHPTSRSDPPNMFRPSHQPRIADSDTTVDFHRFSDGRLKEAVANDNHIALVDFELSVEKYLDAWVESCPQGDDPLGVIASCVDQYFDGARDIYGADPEDNSVMILTILDLWKALDTLAVRQCPLLTSYSPEIPRDFLHPLLLRRSGSLKRAELIEMYILQRHEEATCTTSIFSDDTTESSFALQYYRTSPELERLYAAINHRVLQEREEKRAELTALNKRWQTLTAKALNMNHNHEWRWRYCGKCQTINEANGLEIGVHEWPLPQATLKAQSVVFELSPPRSFSTWRGITYKVLYDIGMPDAADRADPKLLLGAYSGLRNWAVSHDHRISIASTTKSFSDQSHYERVRIPADEYDVLVNNGLSFQLYDRTANSWAGRSFLRSNITGYCIPPIPLSSLYGKLHSFVSGTHHTSNQVIAAQADCPPELSLHEYMAFAVLRSGPRLQWFNIARELSSPSLSFRREEVHTLITQAASQLGPLQDCVREWHLDLGIPSFGETLLHELEALLGRIEANWLEEVTVRTIALLTSRLLSSAKDPYICQRACELLRTARSVAYKWIDELCSKLDKAVDEISRTDLGRRLCTLAATCFSTYGVCSKHVPWILSGDLDIAIALHCAVIVHDNTPPTLEGDDSGYLARLLNRHRRLLHFLEPFFQKGIQSNPKGFDDGIAKVWPEFRQKVSSNWHILPSPNSRWISCTVGGGQEVHYNLLSGKLLICGKPLGRLPQEITKHSTYTSVLGNRILDVVPADRVGMEFMTRSNVSGYQLYFSLRDDDLILQAQGPNQSPLLQLIPRGEFVGDFPEAFVDDRVHWLDLGTGEVEFRPVEYPWIPDPSNWRLSVRKDDDWVFRRTSGGSAAPADLIDIRSATFLMISRLLSPLESPERIIITHTSTRTNQLLEASLPRMRLVFFVNQDSELECRSMPGYVLDKVQSCGTMFGLENQLVLCPRHRVSEMPRRVIIPQGSIEFGLDGDFSRVSISTGSARKVHWHEYTIDTDLGRLTGSLSLRSKLYQCYLHALTNHCLPDPLLGHTGTEESLSILHSAALLSFQRLSKYDAKLLERISNLTPDRVYYPPHLRSMVTVEWNNLPVLSQHHDFHPAVQSILDHGHAMEALSAEPVVFEVPPRHSSLLNRAASRNSVYYPYDLQNSRFSSSSIPEDIEHWSRDVADGESAGHAAYRMSWSVWNDQPYLPRKWLNLWDEMQSWRSIGPSHKHISLRYSRYWLTFGAAEDWLGVYDICQEALSRNPQETKIKLAFSLSAASFSSPNLADIVPLVLIFATDEGFRGLIRPPPSHYELSDGVNPDCARLQSMIGQFRRPIEQIPAQTLEALVGKREQATRERRKQEYYKSTNDKAKVVAQSIVKQWPKRDKYLGGRRFLRLKSRHYDLPPRWFDTQGWGESVDEYLQSISRNIDFKAHIHCLQDILNHYETATPPIADQTYYVFLPQFHKETSPSLRHVLMSQAHFTQPEPVLDVIAESPCPILATTRPGASPRPISAPERITVEEGLGNLIQEFRNSRQSLLQLYGDDLQKSYHDLAEKSACFPVSRGIPPQEALRHHRDLCSSKKDALFSEISKALAPRRELDEVLSVSGLWPRITPRSVLRELSRNRVRTLTDQWKLAITRYAVAFLKYQQSQRLLELSSQGRDEELLQEANTPCEDVAAACSPDWLLIQIDANFLARQLQLDIAREMISPSCGRSASFQLNMGEGKSSVIVPFVAATLADGSNLARIVTLKPLSNQMFQLLFGRLSGLADRRIFYVPFSRNLRMEASVIQHISTLCRQCVDEGGVLVVQPEHLLSLKLMSIDTLITSQDNPEKLPTTRRLKDLQRWLDKVSRDVLDESDEILHVRYQLVYTAGKQIPVEDHPNRWSTTQQVFGLLRKHAAQLHARFPRSFELDQAPMGFPTMRILGPGVSGQISSLLAKDILGGSLSTLSFAVLSTSIREATCRFITKKGVSAEDRDLIYSRCAGTTLWSGILLLRGLLVEGEGILGYVLKERRWRVDYGLDPKRTLLAVPYRAKDVPSLRAEFGHPDVAIALTCLSYYYGGLTKEQVLQCFDILAKLDNPNMEYDLWVECVDININDSLKQFIGVNTDDNTQVDEHLVPLFSRNTRVIDFYLSQVVFTRAAKEFPHKLSTSAWDLVEAKSNVITGFSGTNDNRYLLPTSITQEDPLSQLSTNALVLQYLLRPENNHYECTEGINGERESAEAFLDRLVRQNPEIRVLLDVGAQMLELQNKELAQHWLSLKPHISAAIFFDDFDHLTVLTQDGSTEPFVSSPFNRQLDKCIVYLDDAHTRGTDLKLPRETRAAVTLGPKVTKDRLLQGCMRMRQLGKGQSVAFFAPGEVDRRIRDLIPIDRRESEDGIHVIDILRWAMHETCEDITRHLPHWAQQGLDHGRRFSAYQQYRSTDDLTILKDAWLQPESRTLEEMYDPVSRAQAAGLYQEIKDLPSLHERLKRLGVTQLTDVRMAEEQEREVNHEVERERQVERPPKVEPAMHTIHNDIRTFVRTGKLPSHSTHIIPLLAPTGIDTALDSAPDWSPSPRTTVDFATTTKYRSQELLTDYLRPVNWIVSSGFGKDSVAIVISPYEANGLLPEIRESGKVRLHIYAPKVTASMRSFSDLAFHTIPDPESPAITWTHPVHTRIALNLFAGQLYFDSKEEYERVCELFALSMAHPGAEEIEVDGFVQPQYRTRASSPLTISAITTFKRLTGLRRKGMGYDKTHLGRVLDARPLSDSDLISFVEHKNGS